MWKPFGLKFDSGMCVRRGGGKEGTHELRDFEQNDNIYNSINILRILYNYKSQDSCTKKTSRVL